MNPVSLFLGTIWGKVSAGIVLVLAVLCAVQYAEARHWHRVADARATALSLEEAKHAITRQSVATCQAAVADQNAAVATLKADGDARAKAASDALTASRADVERAKGIAGRLRASAQKGVGSDDTLCHPSDTFWDARGEL